MNDYLDIPYSRTWRKLGSGIEFWGALHKMCESPIEILLAKSLIPYFGLKLVGQLQEHLNDGVDLLIPQYWFGPYRMDFAVVLSGVTIFVECDGREFHSSPEQQARDRDKDAACSRAKIAIARFTGAEINRDAVACCGHVAERFQWILDSR